MRNEFKRSADSNRITINEHLGEYISGTWELAQKATRQIDLGLELVGGNDERTLNLIVLSRNSISDLLCCLDNLEAGHDRTIVNNLRMVVEDYCLLLNIKEDDAEYQRFLKDEIKDSSCISFAKKKEGFKEIGPLYGYLSKVSHHRDVSLLARQVVPINGKVDHISHLKPIDPMRLHVQLSKLLLIATLLRLIAEEAEKVLSSYYFKSYFLVKTENGYIRNLNIKENDYMMKLVDEYQKHKDKRIQE